MGTAQTPFNVIIKPRGPICNLACEYCYYLSKSALYPNSDFKMSLALLENFTRQMIAAQPTNQVDFIWQGGEPTLMGLDFFKEAVKLQQTYAKPGMQVTNALQTNGTTLNPAWCRFFKEHHFLIGLSLDGPPDLHNAFRHTKDGRGSFDAVMRAVKLLKQHDVDFNILCCVHKANQDQPLEVYRFLRDVVGAQFIQFIPILQRQLDKDARETSALTELSVDSAAYGQFLVTVFDEWVRKDVGSVFVQIFDLALGAWMGKPASLCIFSETCGRAVVLEHNGDLYACDHFVDPDNYLGNINEKSLLSLVDSPKMAQFSQAKRATLPQKCLECPYRFVCHGGCPKNRDTSGLNRLCEGYYAFFSHIDPSMQKMANLIRNHRAPAEIMLINKFAGKEN